MAPSTIKHETHRRSSKQGKRIKKNHHKLTKIKNNHLQKSYSPQYKHQFLQPLFYSDSHKPLMSQHDSTQQGYQCYIDNAAVQKYYKQQIEQMQITAKLAYVNLL